MDYKHIILLCCHPPLSAHALVEKYFEGPISCPLFFFFFLMLRLRWPHTNCPPPKNIDLQETSIYLYAPLFTAFLLKPMPCCTFRMFVKRQKQRCQCQRAKWTTTLGEISFRSMCPLWHQEGHFFFTASSSIHKSGVSSPEMSKKKLFVPQTKN